MNTWIISGVFIFLLICAAIFYYFKCKKKISAVTGEIKTALEYLETPREFQDIDAEFKSYNRLAAVWNNFEKSLTKTKDAAYSTTDAAEFFTVQNFTRDMNITF